MSEERELMERGTKLSDFKDIHKNKRCFIIGNGPSLNECDFDLIKNEIIFGTSHLYKGLERFDINPQYYAISDHETWDKSHKAIAGLNTHLFLPEVLDPRPLINDHTYTFSRIKQQEYIENFPKEEVFENFLDFEKKGFYTGYTVVIDIPIQICYYMGFSSVYLLGVDWDYSKSHHFFAVEGDEWLWGFHPEFADRAMQTCKEAYEKKGRKLINCTPNTSLDILPKMDLDIVTFNV